MDLLDVFKKKNDITMKNQIAKLLNMDPAAFEKFEEAYRKQALDNGPISDNLFDVSAKQAASERGSEVMQKEMQDLVDKIVSELIAQTPWYEYDGTAVHTGGGSLPEGFVPVTQKDLNAFPLEIRPQLTGNLMLKDIAEPAYMVVLEHYQEYLKSPKSKIGQWHYHMFRQGLDILDLDAVTYAILEMNQNSIGHWLPPLVEAVQKQKFFKVPATTVIRVPMTLLQLTRCNYMELTPATLAVVDKFCQKVFRLDEEKSYFVKTGTYSSKFDFRNAHVHGAKEVRELGEYLLFIHFLALQMASPLNNKQIYGVSTTNEWVVREYIEDKENNPTIYKGMPLHTEYRVFVDFDTQKVIGVSPYWHPALMAERFSHGEDADSPHQIHDYIVFKAHEEKLMKRYDEHVDEICRRLEEMLQDIRLEGQWSIDIMQNGDDFWLIDMGLAQNSALKECVPAELLRPVKENWIPALQ